MSEEPDSEPKVYWYESPPPALDEWMNLQIGNALKDYMDRAYLEMHWSEEDGAELVCCLPDPAEEIEKRQTIMSILEDELELRRDLRDGTIDPDCIPWMEGLKKAFELAAKRLEEEIARAGKSA